jgi:hypothetical protein
MDQGLRDKADVAITIIITATVATDTAAAPGDVAIADLEAGREQSSSCSSGRARTCLEALSLQDYQVDLLASPTPRPNMFFAYSLGNRFDTLEHAARRQLAASFTAESHRMRVYVLIGHPKDTFAPAVSRMRQMQSIGFTPMAMLWRPETASQEKWTPAPAWRGFQRQWARPAIIHARAA